MPNKHELWYGVRVCVCIHMVNSNGWLRFDGYYIIKRDAAREVKQPQQQQYLRKFRLIFMENNSLTLLSTTTCTVFLHADAFGFFFRAYTAHPWSQTEFHVSICFNMFQYVCLFDRDFCLHVTPKRSDVCRIHIIYNTYKLCTN